MNHEEDIQSDFCVTKVDHKWRDGNDLFENDNKRRTKRVLLTATMRGVEKPRMFLEVYEEHNVEFEQLIGKGLSYRTLQKCKTIKANVAEFMKYQYKLNDIELNRIDYQLIKNLEIYFKSISIVVTTQRWTI